MSSRATGRISGPEGRSAAPDAAVDPELRERFGRDVLPLRPSLCPAALRMTRSPTDAEDVVKETYLRAYRGFSGFREGTIRRAWMYGILANAVINNYRKRQRERV